MVHIKIERLTKRSGEVTALYAGQLIWPVPCCRWHQPWPATECPRRVAAPAGTGMAVASTAVVGVAVGGKGAAELAVSYLAVLFLVTLAGLARAAEAARAAADRDRAVAAERIRIVRDLHDVVGHGMSGITIQAGSARLALRSGLTDEAVRALSGINSRRT